MPHSPPLTRERIKAAGPDRLVRSYVRSLVLTIVVADLACTALLFIDGQRRYGLDNPFDNHSFTGTALLLAIAYIPFTALAASMLSVAAALVLGWLWRCNFLIFPALGLAVIPLLYRGLTLRYDSLSSLVVIATIEAVFLFFAIVFWRLYTRREES